MLFEWHSSTLLTFFLEHGVLEQQEPDLYWIEWWLWRQVIIIFYFLFFFFVEFHITYKISNMMFIYIMKIATVFIEPKFKQSKKKHKFIYEVSCGLFYFILFFNFFYISKVIFWLYFFYGSSLFGKLWIQSYKVKPIQSCNIRDLICSRKHVLVLDPYF